MEENREIEIDLRKVFMMLRKKAAIILIISFIGAALSGCVTNLLIKPKYTAGVSFYVNNNNDNLIGSTGTITSSDLDASERLVNTYMFVVNSRTFLNKVADKLADGTTATQLSKMISTSQVESTLAFQVNVTTENNQFSADVANIIAELAPDEIVRVLKVGGVEVIDYALVNLGRFTFKNKLSLFVELYLHITDNSAHLLEYACKRYHSYRHNSILKLVCQLSELSCRL